jgi:hypothetical protein
MKLQCGEHLTIDHLFCPLRLDRAFLQHFVFLLVRIHGGRHGVVYRAILPRMVTTSAQTALQLPAQNECLTQASLVFIEGKLNYRLLFGHPLKIVDKEFEYGRTTRRIAYFRPGDIFALDIWERNEYGTTLWAVYVLQAAAPGEIALPVPQVKPAAKILLEACGKEKAQRALKLLEEIQERIDPTTLPPNRYLLTDFRLKACLAKSNRKGK